MQQALAGAAQYTNSSTGDALTSKINTQVQAYVEKILVMPMLSA